MNEKSDTTLNNFEEEWKCTNCGKINKKREYCINCNARKCEIFQNLEADVLKYSFKCKKCDSDINFELYRTQLAPKNIKCSKCGEEYRALVKTFDPDNVEVYNFNDEKIYTLKYIRNTMFIPNPMGMQEFMNMNTQTLDVTKSKELDKVKDKPWKCTECGYDNTKGKFCENCGMIRQ